MAINGNNILIYRDGTAIAGTTANEVQSGVDTIEIASPVGSGQWKQYITQRKSWSITVNFLVLQNTGIRELLNVGSSYTIKFKDRSASDATGISGSAILKTCRISGQKGNLVQGTFQFQGNGQIS